MKLLPRILADEDEEIPEQVSEPEERTESLASPLHWGWTLALAVGASIPRLLYIFVFTDPENPGNGLYGDVWHHWQIAYLTKEIGLSAPGGPRLWDLKGLDYFWGVLHPVLMVAIFDITGSIDIVLDRLVGATFGVASVVLLFHICRRYWGTQVAVGAALFAGLLPTSVMNDASGMLEPLGIALCLAGIWAWGGGRSFWSGLAFGLATMARAEAWIFSLGLVVAAHMSKKGSRGRAGLVFGFAGIVALYMALLMNKTGNPIYPLWWNFFANALGKWEVPITVAQSHVRPVLGAALLIAGAGLAWSLVKRPRSYMLLTYGFGYWVFTAGLLGFTSYLADWSWWTPIGRHFEFPYVFAAVVLVVLLVWWAPRRLGSPARLVGWTVVVAGLLAVQLAWIPIVDAFGPTEASWQTTLADSRDLGAWYNQASYQGHALAVPPDRPDITYGLARFGNVAGSHLISEMYDPFAYLPAGYTYQSHASTVNVLVQCWLSQLDVRMIAVSAGDANLALAEQLNPTWFAKIGTMGGAGWQVDAVAVPVPSAADCDAARAAVH